MESPHEPAPPHRPRSGFTLVELLIALVLLDVGLLALAGLSAAISREANRSRNVALATAVATARLERAASVACHGPASEATTVSPSLSEWFSESLAANRTRTVRDSVVLMTTRGAHHFVLRTGARC